MILLVTSSHTTLWMLILPTRVSPGYYWMEDYEEYQALV